MNRSFPLSPTTKPHPPLPLTSGPWPHHVLYWLGTGWWRLGLARASLSNLSKRLTAAHVSAVTWRLSFCVFWPFMWAFFWSFAPIRSWASYDNGLYNSLTHFWFSSLPATLNYYSCRNDLILLDPFLGQPFIPFLSGLSQALFCFYSWAPMSLWTSLWASTARLLFFGLPWPVC